MSTSLTRRQFMACAGACALGALFGASSCATTPTIRAHHDANTLRIPRSTLDAATEPLTLVAEGLEHPVILIPGDSEPIALSGRCTHQGCAVRVASNQLRCPCHGSTFALDGALLNGPAQRPLRRLPLRFDGDNLLIDLGN